MTAAGHQPTNHRFPPSPPCSSSLPPLQDRSPTGGWFCFDDTSVEPWDPAKLDKDCFGGKFVPEGFTQVRSGSWLPVWCLPRFVVWTPGHCTAEHQLL